MNKNSIVKKEHPPEERELSRMQYLRICAYGLLCFVGIKAPREKINSYFSQQINLKSNCNNYPELTMTVRSITTQEMVMRQKYHQPPAITS